MSTNEIDNMEFSKLKLIGYYRSDTPKLNSELTYISEASELAELLGSSFSSNETISTMPDDLLQDILHSVLIFKNCQGHLFAYLPSKGTARISNVRYDRNAITFPPAEYKFYFTPGEPFVATNNYRTPTPQHSSNGAPKSTLDVIRLVKKTDGYIYFEVSFGGELCYVKLLPFQVDMLERSSKIKQITCAYLGLDETGQPKLVQDKATLIDELYEKDTVHTFSYVHTKVDYNNDSYAEYHVMRDDNGLKHRLYAPLSEEQKTPGYKIELYVRGINKHNHTLFLTIFNPEIGRVEKIFYDADKVFEEIGESDNKEKFFDDYFGKDERRIPNLQRDFVGQYNGESNLWLFTYMNFLDSFVVNKCIRKHKIDELETVCQIMTKLQEWMIEGSTFLDLFGEETKSTTITKSTSQLQKYNRLLLAIDIISKGTQNKYIGDIIQSIQRSGRIAINREERIEVMFNILRIYPDYLTQDIENLCLLVKSLLKVDDDVIEREMGFLAILLDYYVEANVRKIRNGYYRSNEIDTSQTILINEILALLCIIVMIYSHDKCRDEMESRAHQARFFRFLSFVCTEEMQPVMLKAGIDALVGIIDTKNIFTWETASNMNVILVSNLTAQAAVLDCNTDNDYYYMKSTGKTGIIRLDSTGFTIVPYKQCLANYKTNFDFVEEIKTIHHTDTLPLKMGTMLNVDELEMNSDAVTQFLLWKAVSKHPENLVSHSELPKPNVGDKVRVCVKKQNQPDKLKHIIFVSVADKRFTSVDGIISLQGISGKWIEDARRLFSEGHVFYAEVISIRDDEKYQFSIRKDVERYSTPVSRVEDDVKHIVENDDLYENLPSLPKSVLQELILLIDMSIRRENRPKQKLTLIGYAYCLSALTADSKSYYYDFLLRFYAAIDKFVTNNHQDVEINFHDTILDNSFPGIENKRRLVELLSYVTNPDLAELNVLHDLVKNESDNDAGKLAAMLAAYIYAQKAGFSFAAMNGIKEEINNYVSNSDKLDLSALKSSEIAVPVNEELPEIDTNENIEQSPEKIDEIENAKSIEQPESEISVDSSTTVTPKTELKPYRLNVFEDGSLQLQEDSQNSEKLNAQLEIKIPAYSQNGILIFVNNVGGISKISVNDVVGLDTLKKVDSKIFPYLLNNHFVVPNECLIGSVISTENGKYIEVFNSSDIPFSTFSEIKYKNTDNMEQGRHQPFILPDMCNIEGLSTCMNTCVNKKELSQDVVEGLKLYGVFI